MGGFVRRAFDAPDNRIPVSCGTIEGDGAFACDVAGESRHVAAFEAICGPRCADGEHYEVTALLTCEDTNPADRNAVAVYVEGRKVGYLPRDTARSWRAQLARRGLPGTLSCNALIVGGWDRGNGDVGHYGIRLDLPMNDD